MKSTKTKMIFFVLSSSTTKNLRIFKPLHLLSLLPELIDLNQSNIVFGSKYISKHLGVEVEDKDCHDIGIEIHGRSIQKFPFVILMCFALYSFCRTPTINRTYVILPISIHS